MKRKIIAIITAVMLTIIAALLPGGAMQTAQAAGTQNWVSVGDAGFSADDVVFTSLALDSSGTPYIAYMDTGNGNKATVMKYTGNDATGWEPVGTAGFSAGAAEFTSLALDSSGTPHVAYMDSGNGNKATVMKYDGSSWVNVGTVGFSAGSVFSTSLAFDPGGTPYVAYTDGGNGNKATVMKFDGSSWEKVGNAGFSLGVAYFTSLAFDPGGTPYVAYQDTYNGKATVMKYDDKGTSDPSDDSWVNVGNARFSAGSAEYTSLALDSSDTPYVAYRDGGNSDKAAVMKCDDKGTSDPSDDSWVNVGTPGFSAGTAYYTSLALDSSGTPYVAYKDNGNDGKATVMKYDGSSWVEVGDAGFSAYIADYTSLALNSSGLPYVAYDDDGNDGKATVMQLNNAPTDIFLDNNTADENEAADTLVGAFTAEDLNTIDNHTYSLVSGTGDDDNGSFTIAGDELKTAEVFDYETKNTYAIRVRATDNDGLYIEQRFTVNVTDIRGDANDNEIVVDMGPVTPKGAVGSAYSFAPTVIKGTAPYSWSATGLPSGLSMDSATGEISGTPTATGSSAVTVTVTDSLNASLTIDFDITIGYADLTIDTPNLLSATIGESYSCSLTASGGDGSNSWYAGGLPDGLSIERDTGKISGTPNETGTFSVEVRVYDGEHRKATKTYSLTVSSPSATGKYEIVPDSDSAYTVSTVDGFTTLTIKSGYSGFRYINVTVNPLIAHEGKETVVFVHMRDGVQVGFYATVADFDEWVDGVAGFNVQPGDTIKIYVVDELSNDPSVNPVLLQ